MPQRKGAKRTNGPKPPSYVGAGEGPSDLGLKAEHYLQAAGLASAPRLGEGPEAPAIAIISICDYSNIRI
jgi:hypothetical protein